MSLRVWLPLNGDLRNNGLSNITVTNNGATVDNNGKIGKCYYFNGSSDIRISMPSNMTTIKNTSVAAWIKSTGSVIALGGISNDVDYTKSMVTLYTSGWQFASGDSSLRYRYVASGLSANNGIWHHVCCTISDDAVTTYLDGNKVTSKTFTEISLNVTDITSANFIEIGCDHSGGDERLTGYVNDFRIYDHALSAKEVKEISKGLVCHYKLDNGSFGGQDNIYDFQSVASKWTADGATKKDYTDPVYGNVLKVNSSSGGKRIYRGLSNIWTEGQKYVVSFLAKADSSCTCDMSRSLIDFTPQFTLTTEWKRYSGVITSAATAAGGTLSFRVNTTGVNVYITQIKLEYGEIATAYKPNKQDPDYNKLGYNSTIVYDSSGYNHHGSVLGTLTYTIDTARNSTSTSFNGTDSGVLIPNLDLNSIINNSATYSFWIKPNGENGARSVYFGMYSGTSWSIEKTTSNKLRSYWNGSPDETCNGTTIADDQWQHICMVKNDANSIKAYVNGELCWESTAAHATKTFSTTCRIGRDTRSGDGTPYKGLMSDFRIYATALNADDVKELYQTSASIDNNGNMFTYEFKED